MAAEQDAYERERWEHHCTMGDAAERFRRDPDAFTAGAQHALDLLLQRTSVIISGKAEELVVHIAAAVLAEVHRGDGIS